MWPLFSPTGRAAETADRGALGRARKELEERAVVYAALETRDQRAVACLVATGVVWIPGAAT